jgi:Uri superfamily endonuclease
MLMNVCITDIRRESSRAAEEQPRWHVAYVRAERSNFLIVPAETEDEARHVAALALKIATSTA